ncbi:MAG: hypothetical protein L0Y55_12360, partial [Anaerolineales bacterium]|nr:hypothetical protein [Anaerolineales bacterium]
FPVQGRLTNASGVPLNGNYTLTFRVYESSGGATPVCNDPMTNVPVNNGLFSVSVYCDRFDGRAMWLGISVGADPEMTPRQPIYPVPYAMSLRPGATISDTIGGSPILHIENWNATGRGLRAYAMATSGENFGVVGASRSPDGYGGYFYNNEGGTALRAQSVDDQSDLILAGNANTGLGDDGILSSDPDYAGSDLVLRTNDAIRVELDNDGDGEDADFEIQNKDSTVIFNVDESGDVTYTGALNGAFPSPAYDSGWVAIGLNVTNTRTHSLGGDVDDYVVDLTCKTTTGIGVNAHGLGGLTWYAWDTLYWGGAYWAELTSSSIKVRRYGNDDSCEQVRIRIWVYK